MVCRAMMYPKHVKHKYSDSNNFEASECCPLQLGPRIPGAAKFSFAAACVYVCVGEEERERVKQRV